MSKSVKALGRRIQKLRQTVGFTQEELAENAEVSAKAIGLLESGRGNPTLASLEAIAAALDISLAEMFDFEHERLSINEIKQRLHTIIDEASDEKARIIYRCLNSVSM